MIQLRIFLALSCFIFIGCSAISTTTTEIPLAESPAHAYETSNISGVTDYADFQEKLLTTHLSVPTNWEYKGERTLRGVHYTGGKGHVWRGPADSVFGYGFACLAMFIVPVTAGGSDMDTLSEYADVLKENRNFYGGETVSHQATTLGGLSAYETTIRFLNPAELEDKKTQTTYRKVTWIVLKKGSYYVDVRYAALEADFDKYLEVYIKAKTTLSIP